MRKKFFFIAVSAIVAVSAGIFAYLNSESKSDDMFSANVEALADQESGGIICYKRIHYSSGYETFYCGTCSWAQNSEPNFFSGTSTCY